MPTDIDDVMVEKEPVRYTERRRALLGSFNISRARIPFFLTQMKLPDAVQLLDLVENLPTDLSSHWKLEELFQREINWERVTDEIVGAYLLNPTKLQFFNALTVALLPTTADRKLLKSYADEPTKPDVPLKFRGAPWEVANIGGVELVTADGSDMGYISWNPTSIFAATIDGQHRLAALRELYHDGHLTSSQLQTSVAVILLVLDPRAGFSLDESQLQGDDNPLLTVVREIFIDLNKSARPVVRAREIILNDQEIESLCVRLLLAPRVGEDAPDRLPLGLVHWQHNVTAKFNAGDNTGPFITTVELLHLIVADILAIDRPKNPFDKEEVEAFVQTVEDALSLSAWIAAHPVKYGTEMPSLSQYVERNHVRTGFDTPFANLPTPYLKAAADAFAETWAPLFIAVFKRFGPYARFTEEVQKRGGVSGELAQFLVLPTRARAKQQTVWGSETTYAKIFRPLRELAAMKSDDPKSSVLVDWAFYAVFQKALLRASADCWRQADVLLGGRPTLPEFIDGWIAFLNELDQRGLLKVRAPFRETGWLWLGVALNAGTKTVKWNESAAKRMSFVLRLWWYGYVSKARRVTTFYKALRGPKANERFPDAQKMISEIGKSLGNIVSATEEDIDDATTAKRVEERIRDILRLGLATAATTTADAADEEEAPDGDAKPE